MLPHLVIPPEVFLVIISTRFSYHDLQRCSLFMTSRGDPYHPSTGGANGACWRGLMKPAVLPPTKCKVQGSARSHASPHPHPRPSHSTFPPTLNIVLTHTFTHHGKQEIYVATLQTSHSYLVLLEDSNQNHWRRGRGCIELELSTFIT